MSNNIDRQFDRDIKYLRKVLSGVDEQIIVPESISAASLRHKLDMLDVPEAPRERRSSMEFLRTRIFSLQSVVSYAVAFVIIVAVVYGLQLGNTDIVDGNMSIHPAEIQEEAQLEGDLDMGMAQLESPDAGGEMAPKAYADTPEAAPEEPAYGTPSNDSGVMSSQGMGVGGGGRAVPLGEENGYTYMYRINDRTDPDKADYPISLEIVNKQSGDLTRQIDISDMNTIHEYYLYGSRIALVGSDTGKETVSIRVYDTDVPEDEQPVTLYTSVLSGSYTGSLLYDQYLRVVVMDDGSASLAMEETSLPDATGNARCIVTAVDLSTSQYKQTAYVGLDGDVSLYNRNIYIPYKALPNGQEETELYMAQIQLEGIDMEMVLVD